MNRMSIFHALHDDPIFQKLIVRDHATVSALLAEQISTRPLSSPVLGCYLLDQLLCSENLLAKEAAAGRELQPELLAAAATELEFLRGQIHAYPEPKWLSFTADSHELSDPYYKQLKENFADWLVAPSGQVVKKIVGMHQKLGFGKLIRHQVWRWQGELISVTNPDPIQLSDLISYERQKTELIENTELFLYHGRGNNALLSGERGTGKSSLIKAVVNRYAADGLCLIEVDRNHLHQLPQILAVLKGQPRRYILFIDDLSFEAGDNEYKELKALLEGSIESLAKNIILYATSNRRHLVAETWQDRDGRHVAEGGEVRSADAQNEKLSLSDRFGLHITYYSPNQKEFLAIVDSIAKQEGIEMPEEELHAQALRWSLKQNKPSGRTARQFVNSLKK